MVGVGGLRHSYYSRALVLRNIRANLSRALCVAVICLAGPVACRAKDPQPPPKPATRAFVGSQACRDCHTSIYDRWSTTLMANVVQDPKQRPNAILGDFSKPNPLVTFTPQDVAFTYGSKWKQRYWKK